MKAVVCVEGRDWEAVVRGAARYLGDGDEAVLTHALDERAARGYDLAVRSLLGRRGGRSEERMSEASERAAKELVAEAVALSRRLRPGLEVRPEVIGGPPNEGLSRAAASERADVVFVGRGSPGTRPLATVSGVVAGWKKNRHGEKDGIYLEDGTDVRFPPHKARRIEHVACEGASVEVAGTRRGRHLHAVSVTDPASGASAEAHETPGKGPVKEPLGRTARFVVDHAPCDVVVLRAKA